MNEQMNEWIMDRMECTHTNRPAQTTRDSVLNQWINKWINEWMNNGEIDRHLYPQTRTDRKGWYPVWMNEWINEWMMNEWISWWMNI